MAFGWDAAREPCEDAVRAAAAQLRVALRELRAAAGRGVGAASGSDERRIADAAVHEARKALRRARAMGELLRPWAGDDPGVDLVDAVRDARRRLSEARDHAVLPRTLRAAWRERTGPAGDRAGRAPGAAIAPLRARLEAAAEGATPGVDRATVAAIAASLEGARHDLRRLQAEARAAAGPDPLAPGLRRMHRRACAAAGRALATGGAAHEGCASERDAAWHDARKRFKELGYVVRWWAPAWRRPIEAWLAEADAFGDLVGADHDQVVLRSRLQALAGDVDGGLLAQVLAASEGRSVRLRAQAARALACLAAEPSGAFVARHLAYMACARAWRLRRGGG